MKLVIQVLANMEYGDAVTNYAVLLDRLLRQAGYATRLYSQYVHPFFRRQYQLLGKAGQHLDSRDVVWLYHYSTASPATQMLRKAQGPVVLVYHNVTPEHYMAPIGGSFASRAHAARQDLADFARVPVMAMADSHYNAADLAALGIQQARVVPLSLDFDRFQRRPDMGLLRALREHREVNFLTVGRLAPHKRIEDVIKVFYYYQNYINPRSRLYVVGDGEEYSSYVHQLMQLQSDLGIPNILFTGKVRFRELLAYYKASDVYLCMSEHEGFCVPLLEAMHLGVPVIAYGCEAVRETLGGAGVVAEHKRVDVIAEMAELLVRDPSLRHTVVQQQQRRAEDFSLTRLRQQLAEVVTQATELHDRRRAGWIAAKGDCNSLNPAPALSRIGTGGLGH